MGERRSKHSKSQPIIFIAHSLGGIVMKRALILANERSDHWSNIPENTTGAMFFGVPHRGADKAYWASFACRLVGISTLGLRGNRSFTDALTRNSSEFSGISNAFILKTEDHSDVL
ncbi:hypothetical protein K456DRAFT_745270 [Colletotrichum gloeosporioides 23]|nr:hypothetical protein K456DRAFT_745270 [Colletotrichum gloeosporioides 23]